MNRKQILSQLGIVLAIVLVVNLISSELYFRIDFTEDHSYTLSQATREVVKDLNEVVTVTAYFSEGLMPQLMKNKQDFHDLLVEYENLSDEQIVFEFVNPNAGEEEEKAAQNAGVKPIIINVTERDQVQQKRAYMGAVLKMGDRKEVIPVVEPGASMEFALTTAIKKISVTDKPRLGLIQGYGEPPLQAIPQLMAQLAILYEVEPFSISDSSAVPAACQALLWINPKDSIAPQEFAKIDRYLEQGGGLFLAYSNDISEMQQSDLNPAPDTGMAQWLAGKGLNLTSQLVIDQQSAAITVQERKGYFTINSRVDFPYFPMITGFERHPITQGLERLILPFVTRLELNPGVSGWTARPLVFTSQRSGLLDLPVHIDVKKEWTETDFPDGAQPVAATLEKNDSRVVVISNGEFCVNGSGQNMQEQVEDNINLASNSIDWIADDTGLIELRTRGITSRPLEQIDDSTKLLLKYGNVFAPIVLMLIYAFVRKQGNKRKRQRWMQGNYE